MGVIFRTTRPIQRRLPSGVEEWIDTVTGLHHRTDGPAVIRPCGMEEWFLDGERHRLDGPALVWPEGHQAWYLNGQHHRPDGPAVIHADGSRAWWVHGRSITIEVEAWLLDNSITLPFTPEQQVEFVLRWL